MFIHHYIYICFIIYIFLAYGIIIAMNMIILNDNYIQMLLWVSYVISQLLNHYPHSLLLNMAMEIVELSIKHGDFP